MLLKAKSPVILRSEATKDPVDVATKSKAIETTTASNGKTIKGGNDFMELKMSKTWKRVISFVLAFAMAFSFTPVTTSLAAPTATASTDIVLNDGFGTVQLVTETNVYDGVAHPATITQEAQLINNGYTVDITYNGQAAAPVDVGNYTVAVTIKKDGVQAGYDNTAKQIITAKEITYTKKATAVSKPVGSTITLSDLIQLSDPNLSFDTLGLGNWKIDCDEIGRVAAYDLSAHEVASKNLNYILTPANVADETVSYTVTGTAVVKGPDLTAVYNGKVPTFVGDDGVKKNYNADKYANETKKWEDGKIELSVANMYGAGNSEEPYSTNAWVSGLRDGDKIVSAVFTPVKKDGGEVTADVGEYNIKIENIHIKDDNGNGDDVTDLYDVTSAVTPGTLNITGQVVHVKEPTEGDAIVTYGNKLPGVKIDGDHGTAKYYVADLATDETPLSDIDADGYIKKPENAEYADELPADKEVGTYKVYYQAEAAANYVIAAGEETGDYIATVDPAAAGNLSVSIQNWTYGDKANVPSVSGLVEPDLDKDKYVTYNYFAKYYGRDAAGKLLDKNGAVATGETAITLAPQDVAGKPVYTTKNADEVWYDKLAADGAQDLALAPTNAGDYVVEAVVAYRRHTVTRAHLEFKVNPKPVKLFVQQPVEFTAEQDVAELIAEVNGTTGAKQETLKKNVKVAVLPVSATAYSSTETALVGTDKLADNFTYDFEYIPATETASEKLGFAASTAVIGNNYVFAETDALNPGIITRATVSIEGADAELVNYGREDVDLYDGNVFRPQFEGGVSINGMPLEAGVDYTVEYYKYEADPLDTYDESAKTGAAMTSVRDAGCYVLVLVAKDTSTKVKAGTKKNIPFEIKKGQIFARGIVAKTKVYDGTDSVEIALGDDAYLYVASEGNTKFPGLAIDDMILTGTVIDPADDSIKTVTRSDEGAVYASANKTFGNVTVLNANIGMLIPENNALSNNYEIVIDNKGATINLTQTTISKKAITIDFADASVTKEYGQRDADVINFKLADIEGNALAPADLINENGVTITDTDYLKKLPILTKRESVNSENATNTPIRVVFASVNDSAFPYTVKFKNNAYTELTIKPVALSSDRVDLKLDPENTNLELGETGNTVDGTQQLITACLEGGIFAGTDGNRIANVDVAGQGDYGDGYKNIINMVDITYYKALADRKTADDSESSTIAPTDVVKMEPNYYVARIVPKKNETNLTGWVDLPFSITGHKINVIFTQTEEITYNPDSKVLDKSKFTVEVEVPSKDALNMNAEATATGLAKIFRFDSNITLELETNGAGDGRSVVVTYKTDNGALNLGNDISATVAESILQPKYSNSGDALALRATVVSSTGLDGVDITPATESKEKVIIETTDTVLDETKPREITKLAARWTYGDEAVVPTVSGFVNELNEKGENRKITYEWRYLGDTREEALEKFKENGSYVEILPRKTTTEDDGAAVEGGAPQYAGFYGVVATVAAGVNYTRIDTLPQIVLIDRQVLHVKAKEASKSYGESIEVGVVGPASIDTVVADDLRGAEAEAYAKKTRSKEKKDYLNGLLGEYQLSLVVDKDVDLSELEGIELAKAKIDTSDEYAYAQAGEYDIVADALPVAEGLERKYTAELISAKYTVNALDLTADNVTVTYLNEDGTRVLGNEGAEAALALRLYDAAQDPALNPDGTIIRDGESHKPLVFVTVTYQDAAGDDYHVVLGSKRKEAQFDYDNDAFSNVPNVIFNDFNLVYYNEAGNEVTNPRNVGKYTIGVEGVNKRTTGINKTASYEITNTKLTFDFKVKDKTQLTYGDDSFNVVIDWDKTKITDQTSTRVISGATGTAADKKILNDIKTAVGADTEFALSFAADDENAGNAGTHKMLVDVSKLEKVAGDNYTLAYAVPIKVDEVNKAGAEVEIQKKSLDDATIVEATGFDKTKVVYVPGGVKIDKSVWLEDEDTIDPEHDYNAEYTANTAVGEATLTFNASSKVGSNYVGSKTYTFTIVQASIEDAIIECDPLPYTNAEQAINFGVAKVKVKVGENETGEAIYAELKEGVDFTLVTDDPEYPAKGTKIGTYGVKIQGKGNYSEKTFATGELKIVAKELRVTGITVNNKTYDGTTALQLAGTAVLDDDARALGWVIKSQPTAVVAASKNAGTQDVVLEGFVLDNTENPTLAGQTDQYTIVPYVDTNKLTVEIAAKELTEITGIKLADKEYDGKKTMTVEGTAKMVGAIDEDNISLTGFEASYEADDADVGAKTIKIDPAKIELEGAAKINYTFTKPASIVLKGEITKKPVTVTGLTLKEKVYDGKAEAEIDGLAAVEGVIAGETVTFEPASRTVTIDSADAGERTFKISKEDIQAALKGETKDNYVVAEDIEVTGKILQAPVTIEGAIKLADKEYDGKNSMTVDATGATLAGVIDADKNDVKIDTASEYMVMNSDAGEKTANIEVKLTGDKSKNYILKNASYEAKGKILPKTVKASGLALKKRVYDQTTTMTVDGTNAKLEGLLTADEGKVTLAFPETVEVADKNAGTKKATVKVALTQSANNYVLEKDEFELTGTITKKGVTLANMKFKDKYYDGSKYMILTSTKGVITGGVLDGDDVAFETKQNNYVITGTKNAGSKKRKLTRGLWNVTGKDAANYQVAAGPTATGTIKKITVKKVTLKATSVKYTGKAQKPVIKSIVGDNGSKILQKNCKVQYYRNGKTTKDFKSKGTITVKVTGVGSADAKIGRNWTGSVSVKYTIK